MFMGLAVGGALGACAGGGAMSAFGGDEEEASPEDAGPPDPQFAWMRQLAKGPLGKLLNQQATFLGEVATAMPDDSVVWAGVIRIANAAIEGDSRIQPGIHALLPLLGKKDGLPDDMRFWIDLVESRSR